MLLQHLSWKRGEGTLFFAKEEGENKSKAKRICKEGKETEREVFVPGKQGGKHDSRAREEDNDRDSPTIQHGYVCFNYIFVLLWRIPDICDKNTARRGGPRERGKSQGKQE